MTHKVNISALMRAIAAAGWAVITSPRAAADRSVPDFNR